MLSELSLVWETLNVILGAIPQDVSIAISFVFCSIGAIAILRSL